MIKVRTDRRFVDAMRLARAWPRRTKALRRGVAFEAAKRTQAALLEKIPVGPEWDEYRESLDVVEVAGDIPDSFALRSKAREREMQRESDTTLLFVRSRKRLKRPDPGVLVLQKYNPWTSDTLPFEPKSTDAVVIARKASAGDVLKVSKRRRREQFKWRAELSREGVATNRRSTKPSKVVSDIVNSAVQLEFGLGMDPKPHWRPALSELRDRVPKRLGRNPKITKLFSDPSFNGWKRWEGIETQEKIRPSDARKFMGFQRKLGIKT